MRRIISEFKIIGCEYWVYILIYMFPFVFLTSLFVIGEPYIYQIMNDPITVLNGEIWTGLGSNIGVLFWVCSASVSIFSASCLFRSSKYSKESHFLICLGLLTLLLSLDDLFLLHDVVLPHFGISELCLYVVYAIAGISILFRYVGVISKYENLLFYIGGSLFCGSILLDLLPSTPIFGFLEDSFKFIGVFSWSAYLFRFSYQLLRSALCNSNTLAGKN